MNKIIAGIFLSVVWLHGSTSFQARGGKGFTLPTCAAPLEGMIYIQGGGTNTGVGTSLCVCTSDGGSSPVFAWCSFKAVKGAAMVDSCLGGSSTVCP